MLLSASTGPPALVFTAMFAAGLLIVSGGTEIRAGAHRGMALLAAALVIVRATEQTP